MALLKPLWMQPFAGDSAIEYLPDQDRLGLLGSIFSREGVIDYLGNHLKVSQRAAGANLSVDVAAGRCVIQGDDVPDQGTYLCHSSTVVNLPITKPGSGTRTYKVIARVRDKSANSNWSGYDWTIEAIFDGTANPVLPASAISLALVTVSSSATSIVSANIAETRSRATVGTNAISGNWGSTGFNANWSASDVTRPLTWTKNADGWVVLGGWIERINVAFTPAVGEFYYWDGSVGWGNASATPVLPTEISPSGGVRDFIGLTSHGDVHFVVFPNGTMAYRFFYAVTLDKSWISFDGCKYRANSF